MAQVRSILNVPDALKVSGVVPDTYTVSVKAALLARYPAAANISVTSVEQPADEFCGQPYTQLTATGEV